MVTTLYTIHGFNEAHVEAVMAEMRTLGAPTIRVVDCTDHYMAIEGTHRLEAAARLGLSPNLAVLDQDETIEIDSLDIDGLETDRPYTAGEIAAEVYSDGAGCYRIEDGQLTLAFNGRHIPTYA
jgi:hypothetical protein